MAKLEEYLRASTITALLLLGFIAGWPKVSPRFLAKLPDSFAESLRRIPEVQQRLLAPFTPIANAFGIYSENWALFATTGGTRNRMCIEGRQRGASEFTLLYRVHDPEHRYLASALEYRRLRNIWNPHRSGMANGYDAFARWLVRRVLIDHAELEAARIRMAEGDILPAGGGFRENGRFSNEVTLERTELIP
ncbi:MAG: hypothetical protein ACOY0T_03800 [Myxococcota bacterium]